MDLNFKWFPLDEEKTDLENITQFLENLPKNIKKLIDPNNSDIYEILKKNKVGISEDLIQNAFKEARQVYSRSLHNFKYKYISKKIMSDHLLEKLGMDLIKIGFTENSLKLKSSILNKLWEQIIDYLNSIGSMKLRFADSKLIQLLSSFLNYLNSILGSISKVCDIDIIKEFKEIIEGIININENLKLFKS